MDQDKTNPGTANTVKIEGYDFFAVEPIKNCPHISPENIKTLKDYLMIAFNSQYKNSTSGDIFKDFSCEKCQNCEENWVCLTCGQVFCSRYRNAHMIEHYETKKHENCLSFSDGSFMCYECDSYITNPDLDKCRLLFGYIKHQMIPKDMKPNWDVHLDTQISEFKKLSSDGLKNIYKEE